MARCSNYKKKNIFFDLKYQNNLVSFLIQFLIKKGKRLLAKKIVYKTFLYIEEQTMKNAIKIFEQAIIKSTIMFAFKQQKTKFNKKNFLKFPYELERFLGIILSIKNIIKAAKKKKKYSFIINLANEIISTSNGIGYAIEKRYENIKEAQNNKFFLKSLKIEK